MNDDDDPVVWFLEGMLKTMIFYNIVAFGILVAIIAIDWWQARAI